MNSSSSKQGIEKYLVPEKRHSKLPEKHSSDQCNKKRKSDERASCSSSSGSGHVPSLQIIVFSMSWNKFVTSCFFNHATEKRRKCHFKVFRNQYSTRILKAYLTSYEKQEDAVRPVQTYVCELRPGDAIAVLFRTAVKKFTCDDDNERCASICEDLFGSPVNSRYTTSKFFNSAFDVKLCIPDEEVVVEDVEYASLWSSSFDDWTEVNRMRVHCEDPDAISKFAKQLELMESELQEDVPPHMKWMRMMLADNDEIQQDMESALTWLTTPELGDVLCKYQTTLEPVTKN